MRKKLISGAIIAAAIGIPTAACGSTSAAQHSAPAHGGQTTTSTDRNQAVSADRNHADVRFATEMIPHHSQAVEMAQLAPTRAASPPIKDLARRIEAAQDPEIQQMRGWLVAWDVHAAGTAGSGHGHESGGEPMRGMMTAEQMAGLTQASGTTFDRLFLQLMVEHHEGAIVASRQQLAAGHNGAAKALAEQIIKAQQAEIAEMRGLLAA